MGVLGVFVLKSGLRILIREPEVPFLVPPKTPKMAETHSAQKSLAELEVAPRAPAPLAENFH